jgi:transposase-like protein
MLKNDVKKTDLRKVKEKVAHLSTKEKQELIAYLKSSYSVFDEHVNVKACPTCGSDHIVKNGTRNGHNKYICRGCKKNFTYRTNTVLSGIQKLDKWNLFVEDFMTLNISSLKDLKFRLGLSEQTIFNWRHKLLSVMVNKEPKFSSEVVEFDDVWFLISRKGRQNMNVSDKYWYRNWRRGLKGDNPYYAKVFFTYGRKSKKLELHLSNLGRVTKKHLGKYFTPSKFNDVTMYTDRHPAYKAFFNDNNIPHEAFIASHHSSWENRAVHVQSVNSHVREFRRFVDEHLKGVSTKYLSDYLKWFQFIHETKNHINKRLKENAKIKFNIVDKICDEVVHDGTGLGLYYKRCYTTRS